MATYTWAAVGNSAWEDKTKWSPNTPTDAGPGAGDDVIFDNTSAANCYLTSEKNINSMTYASNWTGSIGDLSPDHTHAMKQINVATTVQFSSSTGTIYGLGTGVNDSACMVAPYFDFEAQPIFNSTVKLDILPGGGVINPGTELSLDVTIPAVTFRGNLTLKGSGFTMYITSAIFYTCAIGLDSTSCTTNINRITAILGAVTITGNSTGKFYVKKKSGARGTENFPLSGDPLGLPP